MLEIVIYLLFIPILAVLWRFFKSPDAANKILALDTLSVIFVALLSLLSIYFQRSIYIDVAFIFGVVGFAGVMMYARFFEKGL